MFGARVDQLPLIWGRLVEAGFESGHAYGKALRTVKSCVGSTWCRYLLSPQYRPTRGGEFINLSWKETFEKMAGRLRAIIDRNGPDSVALYGSGQLDTEAWYLGNKLFKGHIGSNHVDSNSPL